MKIYVLLPDGKKKVEFAELKELVRQGVVTPTTVLETEAGKQAPARKVAELKPLFAELEARAQESREPEAPRPSTPSQANAAATVPPAPAPSETPDFLDLLRATSSPNAPEAPETSNDDGLYAISLDEPTTESQPSPTPPLAPPVSETPQPPTPPVSETPSSSYYFEGKAPVPFVPRRFRASKKGFYVDSLKALRSAELAHWVAWGRGFLRVFDVLFIVGVVIYSLVFLTNVGIQQYKTAKARQERQRSETFSRLYDALDELGLSAAPSSPLEEEKHAWISLLPRDAAITHDVTEYNFSSKSFEKQFEILEIAEQKSIELEKAFPRDPSLKQKELQSYIKEFRKDLKQARKLKKEFDNVPFPIFRFLGAILLAALFGTLVVALAAFVYGLATILFRILLSTADLYAASFRDDFDPAANLRRDNLLASVETIKTNGAQ